MSHHEIGLLFFIAVGVYGLFVFVAATNWALMRRLSSRSDINFEVMVPARNEAENLPHLLEPLLRQGVEVTVFDDDSTDATAAIARAIGARVIGSSTPLPTGWTGKNRACHELSLIAERDWVVFLDADTRPSESFAGALSGYFASLPENASVATGFLRVLPERGLEPVYLGWVWWVLLATNPFGLVARTGRGHNRFLNGQFIAWRRELLLEMRPYESVRGEILEDVKLGRLLAERREPVRVLNTSQHLSVAMYPDVNTAFEGMSKNAADIAPGLAGSIALTMFFLLVGFGWIAFGAPGLWLFGLLVLSKVFADRVIAAPIWVSVLAPFSLLAGAVTIMWSNVQKARGKRSWKGRRYG